MNETRHGDGNARTQLIVVGDESVREAESHRDALIRAWPRIRPALRAMQKAGFLVVAQRWRRDEGLLDTAFCAELPADPEQSAHRVVGRHTRADLVLRGDDSISLRHLLVTAWFEDERPLLRVLDTGTDARFRTEDGKGCSAMRADGSCFVSAGSWNLMFLHNEPGTEWPESGEEAWERLPPRDLLDAREAWERPPLRARAYPLLKAEQGRSMTASSTQIIHLDDPRQLAQLPAESPLAVGALFLPDRRSVRLTVQALTRGVLIGRYDRCGVDQELLSADDSISRIHLCLVQDPTGLWAVDMASTNGSRAGGHRFRSLKLGRQNELTLARSTRLRWEMA